MLAALQSVPFEDIEVIAPTETEARVIADLVSAATGRAHASGEVAALQKDVSTLQAMLQASMRRVEFLEEENRRLRASIAPR